MDVTVGIYTGDEKGAVTLALRDGARVMKYTPRIRSANDFRDGDTEDFTFAVLTIMRAQGQKIIDAYKARPVLGKPGDWRMPVYVMDYGYLNRVNGIADFETGHWQIGLGGLNKIVPYYCPTKRFDNLGIELHEKGGDPEGYVLVCGQHVGDPSHGYDGPSLTKWATDVVARYSKFSDVVYRPHPASPQIVPEGDFTLDTSKNIGEALNGASLLVTICSNSGHDALLAGVPALATEPWNAAWSELSGAELPSYEQRLRYFARVACSQWTVAEIASGQWYKYLAHVDGRSEPFGRAPEVIPTVAA